MSFGHGLVIGKFYPPHRGHHHLIETAAAQVERLTVLVLASSQETVPLKSRVGWLREVHASSKVRVVGGRCDVPMDLDSPTVWAAHVAIMRAVVEAHTDERVDAVFSSESYGPELARRFGARHVAVDPARGTHQVSGTAVRADLADSWDHLHPVVRAGLTTRLVVVGSESTGTTTVSRAIAQHYRARGGVWSRTGWVPEHGRDYTVEKHVAASAEAARRGEPTPPMEALTWHAADFARIAGTQAAMEEQAAREGSPLLVCDTDALATRVWERRYVGPGSRAAADAVPVLPPRAIYLLTDHVGVPFVQDGWRDGEHVREAMTGWFVEELTTSCQSWALLTGSLQERIDLAVRITENALRVRSRFAEPLGSGEPVHVGGHCR